MNIDATSITNALVITYNGQEFLFTGDGEDFEANYLLEQFCDMTNIDISNFID